MIGICGFLRLDGAQAEATELARIQRALPGLGVPSFAGQVDRAAALGAAGWHAQLAVDAAPALYRHAGTGVLVVADARLQRRDELARSLGLPAAARTGDAELIAHAWLRHGEDCAAALDGDFAFAVWDPRSQRLFCARDIMGVRPLHVHHAPGRLFAFATRANALLALPGVPDDLDEGRIADTLVSQLESVDKTSTFYLAVKRLPPAHQASVEARGLRQRRYWELQPGRIDPLPRTDAEWSAALTDILERVVARHLEGDVAVGCMLSGGMDSSTLAVIARDQLAASGRGPLATFSSIDNDPACAETRAIRAMLEQPGFAPTLIDPDTIESLRGELQAAGRESDEPFDGTMFLLHAQYLMAARRGMGAVMDGIDADTLLSDSGAITRQVRALRWHAAWRNARGLQRMHSGIKTWKTLALSARGALAPQWLKRALHAPRQRREIATVQRDSLLAVDFARRIDLAGRLQTFAAWSPPTPQDDAVTRGINALMHPNTTLGFERYTRVAARHGVDPRHPFDDRELLEFGLHLPDTQCLADGWTKVVLRNAMRGRLPDSVCWRTGKEHLGWGLTGRLVLGDRAGVRERLAGFRPLLAPYVDLTRLDAAARQLDAPDRGEAHQQVLDALNLGQWLANRRARQGTC